MATYNFGIQKFQIFGTSGEFSVGSGATQIRAQYILTKMRPGQEGNWENQLASQMKPWREVFKVEELTFEELIQRELDDSRVAHDLIPYLLGESGHSARFFPPILAVMVPRRKDRSGIAPYYPKPVAKGSSQSFGDLFDYQQVQINDQPSPLAVIDYNSQQTAMVIVDGQHRAMAVLALHRQLNKSWDADAFASYYSHIQVSPSDVAHIELPVCLMFFPDLYEGSPTVADGRIDLTTVSREIFTVVNKQAKEVSQARELLLDDEDFAAAMMRQTLSEFKNRDVSSSKEARIYSFAFGDSEADSRNQVMAGQLEYSSAVAVHKMHAATGFGLPGCYSITNPDEITDGRKVRNPARPIELLRGISEITLQSLSRRSFKNHVPSLRQVIVRKIGSLTDRVMLPLFDRLRPFAVHNEAMQELKTALEDPSSVADPVQNKCRSLIFEGGGARHVFEEHTQRLKDRASELRERGEVLPSHLVQQLAYCESVIRAIQLREDEVRVNRALNLFNIDKINFSTRDKATVDSELKIVRARAKSIFDTVSTQAFQLGYLMATLSLVELMLPDHGAKYDERLKITEFTAELLVAGINSFFSVSGTKHKTLTGYVAEQRARAFESSEKGFRGLLAAGNVREINEKHWDFFRYVIYEIVHSKNGHDSVHGVLSDSKWSTQAIRYREILPQLLSDLETLREQYFASAIKAALNAQDFLSELETCLLRAKVEGKSDADAQLMKDGLCDARKAITLQACKDHLKGSLKVLETKKGILRRLSPASAATTDAAEGENQTDQST